MSSKFAGPLENRVHLLLALLTLVLLHFEDFAIVGLDALDSAACRVILPCFIPSSVVIAQRGKVNRLDQLQRATSCGLESGCKVPLDKGRVHGENAAQTDQTLHLLINY